MTRGFEHDYRCSECDYCFTTRYGFDGPRAAITCPECNSANTRKVYSQAPAITYNWWKGLPSDNRAGLTHRRHHGSVINKLRSKT